MSLKDIIESGVDISITIKASDLNQFAHTIIENTRIALEREITEKTAEKLITIEMVAEMFQVDRSTLYRWANQGYLCPIEVGGKKRYRLSDLHRIMNQKRK